MRAIAVLALYERKENTDILVMDGLAVDKNARGQGVGTTLLQLVIDYATSHAYKAVRLDVIDTNPRAKQLYQRLGFVVEKEAIFRFLRPILGFSGATTMHYHLPDDSTH